MVCSVLSLVEQIRDIKYKQLEAIYNGKDAFLRLPKF